MQLDALQSHSEAAKRQTSLQLCIIMQFVLTSTERKVILHLQQHACGSPMRLRRRSLDRGLSAVKPGLAQAARPPRDA